MSRPIIAQILELADKVPEKNAVISSENAVGYGELAGKIVSAAALLESLGIGRGDRVILAASNTPSFIYGYFATHLIGAIAIPVDPRIADANFRFIADEVSPRAIYTSKEHDIDRYFIRSIDDFDHDPADSQIRETPGLDDIADILFTTGTSGKPKGVVLSHGSILSAATNINSFVGNTADDREVIPLPLSHSFGLGRLRCNMLVGGTIILAEGFVFPGKIFRAIERWQATGFCFVPSGFAVLLRLSGDKIGAYSDQLRYIEIGSAPMPLEHKRHLMHLLPKTRICMHYGLTEASRAAFIEFHESKDKLDSIGKSSPNVDLKVVAGEEHGGAGREIGEIFVRGGMVMKCYWNDAELTASTIVDGWLRTGDIGYQDEDGFFYLYGREKELISIGGKKVSPVEIEDVLNQHGQIEECACVAIIDPDGISGEAVKAFVVARPEMDSQIDESDLVEFLRGRIEEYKIPKEFVFTEAIPKTTSGKIQRQLLIQEK